MILSENSDNSLICLFNISSTNASIVELVNIIELIFEKYEYPIKKIYYSECRKTRVLSPKKINQFKETVLPGVDSISFQSDFNKTDFEPNTRLYVYLNNRYIESGQIIKLGIVINNGIEQDELLNNYKMITECLSNINNIKLSGYSFLFPNYYGAVSFSCGIIRKPDMPCTLNNLSGWYGGTDLYNNVLGLMNCFSNLSESQINILLSVFGKENVCTLNNLTITYNHHIRNMDISDYINSENYNSICNILENGIPFKRMRYYNII